MPVRNELPIPYLLDPGHLAVDDVVSFCVAILVAVLVNAEAQSFAAVLLGDSRPDAKDRLHFNAFLHLDVLGSICFLLGGFGWPRGPKVDGTRLQYPRFYTLLISLAGPLANFLMANIAASVMWIIARVGFDYRVFTMLLIVNLTMAVYNVIPIPPLAGATILTTFIPERYQNFRRLFWQLGPFILVAAVLIQRIYHWEFISSTLDPVVRILFKFIVV